jgi:hypothetical protein
MIRNFVGGGFKIQCFYCKTFNIIYPQDPDYMHAMLQPCLRQDSALANSGQNTIGINTMI